MAELHILDYPWWFVKRTVWSVSIGKLPVVATQMDTLRARWTALTTNLYNRS